jgi:hypothetical protein
MPAWLPCDPGTTCSGRWPPLIGLNSGQGSVSLPYRSSSAFIPEMIVVVQSCPVI